MERSAFHPQRLLPLIALILSLSSIACNIPVNPSSLSNQTSTPLPAPSPFPPTPTLEPVDSGWLSHADGLAQRTLRLVSDDGVEMDRLTVLRIDPALYQFDVGYTPGQPKTLNEWQAETGALIVVNGGFFTAEYQATGLTIVDRAVSGWSYDFGGMVVIQGGNVRVRSLSAEPYIPNEPIDAGLQAFPLLIRPDGSGYTKESSDRARRTVIAQDGAGHILLIATARSYFTLSELSAYLLKSDLNLSIALNLDGGTSTGLLLTDPYMSIPPLSLLPTVLTVHAR